MANQTERRPETKLPTRPAANPHRYRKQTASHVEARRDGKPLIFGYGKRLTRTQKTQVQRLAIWGFIGLVILAVIVAFSGFWIDFNVVIPNLPIANVNGQNIPQSAYKKLVAVNGQIESNKIKGKNGLRTQESTAQQKQTAAQKTVTTDQSNVDSLNKKLKAAKSGSSEYKSLQSQLNDAQSKLTKAKSDLTAAQNNYSALSQQEQVEETIFTQEQMATESVQYLQEDLTIRNWLNTQSTSVQNQINPTDSQVTSQINDLKAHLPSGTTYQQFLSTSGISDGDVHAAEQVLVRRSNMQKYLANQIASPARQVDARIITFSTQKDANSALKQLKSGSDFAALAKSKSVDDTTKKNGGELGWLADGQYMLKYGSNLGAVLDNWISDPSRKAGDLSSVLSENGTWHIIQIENVDASRAISSSDLSSLKSNALTHWVAVQKAKGAKFSDPDTDKMLSTTNMPSWIPDASTLTPTATDDTTGTGTTGTDSSTSGQ